MDGVMDHRVERISEALREELTELIAFELSDPRMGSATVTEVQISPDKRHAFVRIAMADGSDSKDTLAVLNRATNFLRREIASRLELFRVPELHFEADASTAIGPRAPQLLKRIKKGRPRE
jgi:ribosome-binding factor A